MHNVIEILKDLVKIDSTNPPGNENDIIDYITSLFPGYENIKVIDHNNNRKSLIIEVPGASDEVLAFCGHLDTVPIGDIKAWDYDPFEAKIIDDTMYGRGSCDTKSSLACMIHTALYFLNNNILPKKTIRLVFTSDEECNAKGAKELLKLGYFDDVKTLIIAEPSDEHIVTKEKGTLWLQFKIHGKASHGASPHLGINSIEKLYELVECIKPSVLTGEKDSLLGKSSVAINKITAGNRVNITADYCEAEIDIRTIPSINHDTIMQSINNSIEKMKNDYKGLNIEFHVINDRIPLMIEENHNFVIELKNTLKTLGYNDSIKGVSFFTDGSIILKEHNIPFVIYGPGKVDQCHVSNEHVSLSAVVRTSNVYINLLS